MQNKFVTFIKPYLTYIDSGNLFRKPFYWLYTAFAIINILFPIVLFFQAIDKGIFKSETKFIIVFLLLWIIIAFASWISFQLWWDRRSKIDTSTIFGDDFIATPAVAHYIQTFGEWLGTWIGIVGFGTALITTIILGDDAYMFMRYLDIPYLDTGILAIVTMPIAGFLIVVFSRLLSEQIKALAAIANNTKKIT